MLFYPPSSPHAALLLGNPLLPSPPLFLHLSSPFTPHSSWTPALRYSVYKHRYGRLCLLTVSTLNPHPSPTSHLSTSCFITSLLKQQGGRRFAEKLISSGK